MRIEIDKAYVEYKEDICEEDTIEISMLYVPFENRGNKLGYRLLEGVKEWSINNGYTKLSLCAYPQEDNGMTTEELVEYYRLFGFEQFENSEIMFMEIV